ncbi:OmpH family outer membrane protein [Orenia marismortui]|uniref:Periplasmic chaperone for outer membrane proteins Skp n=1 Tax=Orenia marismortui TaxID=46469 RepID=A0A4R8HGG9_9FIRM|nr:OmpH family outer membrane protein [Orenia marismortui]TDX59192.1 periplasmic chaperone for outer membrane proteins Skp [Orenia marismortui]
MKKLFIISILLVVITALLVGCAQPVKDQAEKEEKVLRVGVINQDRIWTESAKAKEYQSELNTKIEGIQDRYKDELENLSEEEQVKKHEEAYKEINNIQTELKEKFRQEIQSVVEEIAKTKNLDIVLNKEDVRYGGIDLTDEVIKKLK